MEQSKPTTEAEAVEDLAHRAASVASRVFVAADGRELALVRDHTGAEKLVPTADGAYQTVRAGRIAQAVTVETEDSLTSYASKFKDRNSLLLASIASNTIVAVLDYHHAEETTDEGSGEVTAKHEAAFGGHKVTLSLPFSMEWEAWSQMDGKLVPQLDFVRFLEENREDIRSPDAATVLEACRDLQALRRVNFTSVVREDSENYRIAYEEETDARSRAGGQEVTLPSEFVLGLPIYFDDDEHEVTALLRWKLDGTDLRLGIKLKRAERIRQAVFKGIVQRIAETTGIDAVYGRLGG